jgi:DNA helicase-2/ATP-dependent DNA helicase PcrA
MPVELPSRTNTREYADSDWEEDFNNKSKYYNGTGVKKNSGNGAQKPLTPPAPIFPRRTIAQSRTASADFKADNPDQIQSGMKVEHATFGIGKIVHIEGISPNRKATVFFQENNEEKQLLLKFAKLRIVN